MRAASLAGPLGVTLLVAASCGHTARLAYPPDALRAEIAHRVPDATPEAQVIPFEIPPEAAAAAKQAVRGFDNEDSRVRAIVAAMFDPARFGLRYGATAGTTTATETLRVHEGNCVSLASVFVGLARAVGLKATYMASTHMGEARTAGDGITVHTGHLTAAVVTPEGKFGLDFARQGPIRWYRMVDDLEALAHFHNNLAYEQVEQSRGAGAPVDWTRAADEFRLAVRLAPGFAPAWNNLGVASARLGRPAEAVASWDRAIAAAPQMVAPKVNLGVARLQGGDLPGAIALLEAAAELEPDGPRIHYLLGVARLRHGDRDGAIRSLRRAVELPGGSPDARTLLDGLAPPLRADAVPKPR